MFDLDQGTALLDVEFSGDVIVWRGPAPFYFLAIPEEPSAAVHAISGIASYGWGCIPVAVSIGGTDFTTALIPKDGLYLVPIKAAVRRAEAIEVGDVVTARVTIGA
jgi:hypothetical protein